jgi:hypothetical protein
MPATSWIRARACMDDSNSMNINNSRVTINSKGVINSREANNDDFENVDLKIICTLFTI